MDAKTVNQLAEINHRFYSQFSADFSDTRSSGRLNLQPFRNYLANRIRLLDAGCGNGRLAAALDHAGFSLDYTGIDATAELVAIARQKSIDFKNVRAEFRVLDLTTRNCSESLRDASPFDLIVSLAVLHHIPSFELRAQVLRELRALVKPGGILVMSNWQFLNEERLQSKIVPWAVLEIRDEKLEQGDYLLNWKRGGMGYRYVHWVNENEIVELAKTSGLAVLEQFYADNNLNLYSILKAT